jgi:hypothetical protein
MLLLKLGPNANITEVAAYLAGGPLGIISSMWAHRHFAKKPNQDTP